MKFLLIGALGVVSTGCGVKYQSYVEGVSPKPEIVKAAVDDLVDVFDRSDATADKISIHPAEGDRIMRPLLEQRLRISGYSVSNIKPGSKPSAAAVKTDRANKSVPIRYRASFVDGVGTFCIGISGEKKSLCRMYNSEGSPVSSITHTGFKIDREDKFSPDDVNDIDKREMPRFEATGSEPQEPREPREHRSPRPVKTAPIMVKPVDAMTVEVAEPVVQQAVMADPVDEISRQAAVPVAPTPIMAEPADAMTHWKEAPKAISLVENKQVVPDYDTLDKSAGVWIDLEEALKEQDENALTTPQLYQSVPNNLLKRNLDLFIEGLPSEFKISAVTQRFHGESESDYRSRLMGHIEDAMHFIKTGAFAYDSTLTVSANE